MLERAPDANVEQQHGREPGSLKLFAQTVHAVRHAQPIQKRSANQFGLQSSITTHHVAQRRFAFNRNPPTQQWPVGEGDRDGFGFRKGLLRQIGREWRRTTPLPSIGTNERRTID